MAKKLIDLGLPADPLPLTAEPNGDALDGNGAAATIDAELDLLAGYVGWTALPTEVFGDGGPMDCADPEVFCSDQPADLGGMPVLLVALRTDGHITFGGNRDAALTVAFDRTANDDAPPQYGLANYASFDKVIIASLDLKTVIGIEYSPSLGWVRSDPAARVKITGDTAVFIVPWDPAWGGTAEIATAEHSYRCSRAAGQVQCVPPSKPAKALIDVLPDGAKLDIDSSLSQSGG